MNKKIFAVVHEIFQALYAISLHKKERNIEIESALDKTDLTTDQFLNQLFETGASVHLTYFRNWMSKSELEELMFDLHFPVLLFAEQSEKIEPIILLREKGIYFHYNLIEDHPLDKKKFDPLKTNIFVTAHKVSNDFDPNDKILVVTCFPNQPIFSAEPDEDKESATDKLSTVGRLIRVLRSEKREIGYIYIYAIISGIIALSLPLGVQSIIGFISSGQISTSVIVLISFIIIGTLITGGLQVMQLWLVEHIQQRIFTKTAFEFAFRIPKIKIESVLKYYPPELMNRFFDIITLQKGLAKMLIEFSAALLQILLGLILLSLYHSSFIFFGLFLVMILALILRFTGPRGLKTSLKESKYKYMLANWLEEIARSLSTFKLAGYSNLPMEKTDYYVSNYLYARKSHFKILIIQYLSFIGFKTLITGGLLILGCVLLIEKQINIGQFVASEIIIILIMNAVEKIIIQLDTVYDVLTSIEKIGAVTDLPIEIPKGIDIRHSALASGLSLKIKNLTYKYPAEPVQILKGINLEVSASERICLTGYSSSGKTTLINIILGFLTSYEGLITFNNISLHNINKNSLISLIGDNISQEDLFDGTLLENITLGRQTIHLEDVLWAIDCVGLTNFVHSQPEGLHAHLVNGKLGISESVARKIILARSIVNKPKLLILEDFMLGLEKDRKLKLLDVLSGKELKWTLIVVSNDQEIMSMCDRTVIMKEGSIVYDGLYQDIKQDIHFNDLI